MGTHNRQGHVRTSKNGNVHWVSEHSVQRDDFRRSSCSLSSESYTRPVTKEHPQQRPSGQLPQSANISRALTRPNATCPVCGVSVYFYSNSAGSKVYFDALGLPWPKHPCMDCGASLHRGYRFGQRRHRSSRHRRPMQRPAAPWTPARTFMISGGIKRAVCLMSDGADAARDYCCSSEESTGPGVRG